MQSSEDNSALETESPKSIRVFELYPIEKIVGLKAAIQKTIFGDEYKIDNENLLFSISNSSGWMNFSDHTQLWQSENSNYLAKNKIEIEKVAETFLDNINAKIIDFNVANNSYLPSFFPGKISRKLSKCYAVKHRNGSWIDHWLCIYQIFLQGGINTSSKSLVYGMSLDIRIGKNNKIIGFSSKWRPNCKIIYTDLFLPDQSESHHSETSSTIDQSHIDGKANTLIYLFDGDSVKQSFLSPYYCNGHGHHLQITSACKFSLDVFIFQINLPDSTKLYAFVSGGSGKYFYNWAYWDNKVIWNIGRGFIEIGEGKNEEQTINGKKTLTNCITLPLGVYNIMLNVTDSLTGAFKQTQQIIFSKQIIE